MHWQLMKRRIILINQDLAQELEQIPLKPGVIVYQHTDDILIEVDSSDKVQRMHYDIIIHLEGKGSMIPKG